MAQVDHDTTLQGVRAFFGGKEMGEVFTHLNYVGSEFSKAINADNVESIENQPIFQLLLAKNYNDTKKDTKLDNYIHHDIVRFIQQTAYFHKHIDNKNAPTKTTANDNIYVKFLIESVYKNWSTLSSDVRNFYSQHLHVLNMNVLNMNPLTNKWGINDNPENLDYSDLAKIRVNLTKQDKNDSTSKFLFPTTLPRLPPSVKGVILDASGRTVEFTGLNDPDRKDYLEKIYDDAYNSSTNKYSNEDNSFNLESAVFLKNVIEAHAKKTTSSKSLDDLYAVDMTTNVTYTRKDGKLYRDDKEVIPDDDLDNCYGTKLKLSPSDCDVVFRCLLNGNPKNLSRCLGKLKDQNMFNVAKDEVQKMNHSVAQQLLSTFGFKIRKELPSGLKLPPSFDEWKNSILPRQVDEETKKAILGNKQLMEYLHGVVSLLRNNPEILNKDHVQKESDYVKQAGIKLFQNPITPSDKSRVVASVLEQGVLLSRPAISNFPLGGLFNNVGLNQMGMMGFPLGLSGGGAKEQCVNANMLQKMFETTYNEMERNGKMLVDADKDRISEAIKKVGNLEEQLIRILEDLKLFSKLNEVMRVGTVGIDDVTLEQVKDEARSKVSGITYDAVNNLKDCAGQNIAEQSKLMSDLLFQVQRSLIGTLVGDGNNSLLNRVY
jgi:hypothetical protein